MDGILKLSQQFLETNFWVMATAKGSINVDIELQ